MAAINELKEPNFSETDKILYECGASSTTRRELMNNAHHQIEMKAEFTVLVHDLIKLRDKILKVQQSFLHHNCNSCKRERPWEYGKIFRLMNKLCKGPEFSIFKTWDIAKKSDMSDDQSVCISDDEDNTNELYTL